MKRKDDKAQETTHFTKNFIIFTKALVKSVRVTHTEKYFLKRTGKHTIEVYFV